MDFAATAEAIAAAYRTKARLLHPDVPGTGNTDAFVALKHAYDVLSDLDSRAAYDRQARRAAQEEWEPGVMPPPREATPPPIPMRQPRASDLHWAVWLGLGVVLTVGVVQVARHLTALPPLPPGPPIPARAPVVAPAAPAQLQAANESAIPIRLVGNPNFYITPAAGPTVLWRRDDTTDAFLPAGRLPPFSSVQALRLLRPNGLIEIRTTDTATGFIEASRLTPGNAAAAHRAYCAYHAGGNPENGEILQRRGKGQGRLEVDNRTTQPAVLKLRDPAGVVVVAAFLAPGGHTTLVGLPEGRFQPDFAIGELWSRTCRGFAAGMRAQRLSGYFSLAALTPLSIPPDLPGEPAPTDISDDAFERE